jgi:hypothetical protein
MHDAVGEPMFMNGYSYANADPVNFVDPSGNAAVGIWAAAFIAPAEITFPYADAFPDPGAAYATWDGDDRLFSIGPFTNTRPLSTPSSRVWWWVGFDTCDISTLDHDEGTGVTEVVYYSYIKGNYVTLVDQAPFPDPPIVRLGSSTVNHPGASQRFDLIEVDMEAGESGRNPLVDAAPLVGEAPPIVIDYDITFNLTRNSIGVSAELTDFPWQELLIWVNGIEAFAIRQAPQLGLPIIGPTPFDLFPGGVRTYHQTGSLAGTEMEFSCDAYGYQSDSPVLTSLPAAVYDIIDVDCLFA